MRRNNTSVFSKIWKFGKRGCTAREKYLDLPDGIRVPNEEDCVCAQICAFKGTNDVWVYNLHYPGDEVDNWGEFVELHELPMKCLKTILDFIDGLGSTKRDDNVLDNLRALTELKYEIDG